MVTVTQVILPAQIHSRRPSQNHRTALRALCPLSLRPMTTLVDTTFSLTQTKNHAKIYYIPSASPTSPPIPKPGIYIFRNKVFSAKLAEGAKTEGTFSFSSMKRKVHTFNLNDWSDYRQAHRSQQLRTLILNNVVRLYLDHSTP